MPTSEGRANGLIKARATFQAKTAHRATEDPIRLAKAARIVRAALARRLIELDELTPLPDPDAAVSK